MTPTSFFSFYSLDDLEGNL